MCCARTNVPCLCSTSFEYWRDSTAAVVVVAFTALGGAATCAAWRAHNSSRRHITPVLESERASEMCCMVGRSPWRWSTAKGGFIDAIQTVTLHSYSASPLSSRLSVVRLRSCVCVCALVRTVAVLRCMAEFAVSSGGGGCIPPGERARSLDRWWSPCGCVMRTFVFHVFSTAFPRALPKAASMFSSSLVSRYARDSLA